MLHHVEINVSDLARSVQFWGWLLAELGYAEHQRWEGGRSWISGQTYIVLVQTDPRHLEPPFHRRRAGLNHLAFHARSREQVDAIVSQLRERGIAPLYPERHPHAGGRDHHAAFFEDPDRIKVELVAPAVASPRVPVFFYGSYMNRDVLAEVNLVPGAWEVATLPGFDVLIQPRANLVRSATHTVCGLLATATHAELDRLYAHAHDVLGETYLPEAVLVHTLAGACIPALCYIAPAMAPRPAARDYVERILRPARAHAFPDWYLRKLEGFLPRA